VGLSEEEIRRAQTFESEDEGRTAALRFAREVVENRGHPSNEAFEVAREAGYTNEQIVEMISTVVLATFTNYLNDSIGTEVDLPLVEPVDTE
jgi:alkylhydroperoxidase family enzyme